MLRYINVTGHDWSDDEESFYVGLDGKVIDDYFYCLGRVVCLYGVLHLDTTRCVLHTTLRHFEIPLSSELTLC